MFFVLTKELVVGFHFGVGWRNTISKVDVINGEEAKTRLVELTSRDLE